MNEVRSNVFVVSKYFVRIIADDILDAANTCSNFYFSFSQFWSLLIFIWPGAFGIIAERVNQHNTESRILELGWMVSGSI